MSIARILQIGIVLLLTVAALEMWQYGLLQWHLLILVFSIVLLFIAHQKNRKLSRLIKGGLGISQSNAIESRLSDYFKTAQESEAAMGKAISAIRHMGQNEFPDLVKDLNHEHIRASLLDTHHSISTLRKKEQENNWTTQGVAAISRLKHQESNVSDYALHVITTIVKYLKANQGGFFRLNENGSDSTFELSGCYAYERRKYLEKKIGLGEGLLGQLYYEREIILLTEIPNDYLKITSGLGAALPSFVCLVPLLSEGKMYGAIEIASFRKLENFEIEYLKAVSEVIAYNLKSIENHQQTEKLLLESQQMATEVKSQEEELRQNMEELVATQEEMSRKQREMDAVLASLAVIELDINGCILEANSIFLGITGYETRELTARPYIDLMTKQGNDRMQYDLMWSSLMEGRTFSGEFKILNKAGKEIWMLGNFTPLLDTTRKPYKIMVISMFTTQDKEKVIELQETVNALKNCFPIAEINPDLTFKSANDLFLTELGVKRLELKKLLLKDTFHNGSFKKVENYFSDQSSLANTMKIDLQRKNGEIHPFLAILSKVTNNDKLKKGILILQKPEAN